MTPKGQTQNHNIRIDPNTLKTKYLENSWRCYL